MKSIALKALIAFALLLTANAPAHAVYEQNAKVRYYAGFEKTHWQTAKVTFATADEISRAGISAPYGFFSYAIVPYADGKKELIKIETRIICSSNFEKSCMPILGKMQGVDNKGRGWEICTAMVCPL